MDIPILNVLSAYHGALKSASLLQYKYCFTIGTREHLQLDKQYSIGAKPINHEDLMLVGVEMEAQKSVKRRELE